MSILEFTLFIIIISFFLFGFLYCLYRETTSNCELRKRMIQHMKNIEFILDDHK